MVTKKDKPASKSKTTGAVKKKALPKSEPVTKTAPKKKISSGSSSGSKYPWLKKYPEGISWDAKIEESPLYELLETAAAKFPDRYLLDFLGKKYTYAEISNLVDRAAKGLLAQGIKKGTRLGLFLPNCPVYVVFYYAAMKIGATVVNFSPLYAAREVATQIDDSNTEVMVTLDLEALYPKVYKMFERTEMKKMIVCPLKDQLPFPKNILFPLLKSKEIAKLHRQDKRLIFFNDLIDNDGQSKAAKITPRDDIALIQYTGGTTGLPKGALLTHANVTANASQADMWFLHDGESKEKVLAALPLFHVFAMTAVMNL
ncbi:MAG: AMP-binding protein, partial [Alphaproteobacteria bacterium]|nr:AMP-binding protein [Alphaproteobacteria bacterium]